MVTKDARDAYLDTVSRMEPEIAMIDSGAGFASIAVSLKRIADAMDKFDKFMNTVGSMKYDIGTDTSTMTFTRKMV